jgi:hypothetical protein
MHRLSNSSRIALIPLSLIATLLGACSTLPPKVDPPPVVIQGQKPKVDSDLMTPPQHQAIDHLLKTLGLPPVNVVTPFNASAPSKPN